MRDREREREKERRERDPLTFSVMVGNGIFLYPFPSRLTHAGAECAFVASPLRMDMESKWNHGAAGRILQVGGHLEKTKCLEIYKKYLSNTEMFFPFQPVEDLSSLEIHLE
jgi:hypothetical protein